MVRDHIKRGAGINEEPCSRTESVAMEVSPCYCSSRYKVISYPLSKRVTATPTNCVQILMQAGLEKWAMGKTKVSQVMS